MLLGLAAGVPTGVALTTELVFALAGKRGLFTRQGATGYAIRKTYRSVERKIPWLSAIGAAGSVFLGLAAGPMTRAGWLAFGAALAIGAHHIVYAKIAESFQEDAACLECPRSKSEEMQKLQARWDAAMSTRASLMAGAMVCIVAAAFLR